MELLDLLKKMQSAIRDATDPTVRPGALAKLRRVGMTGTVESEGQER